jgi:alkylhydroperoxidase family enzyme
MARVPYLDQQDLAAEHRDLLKRSVNIVRALANSPNGLREFSALSNFIRFKSRLDPRLRELAILMVGYLTRSPYEWSHHVEIGRRFGVSDTDIRALMDEAEGRPSSLEPLARSVLQAATEMTRNLSVSDATFAELRAGLDNERTVDLVVTIAFYNAVVRVLASLQIDVESDYQRYLDEFPLPPGAP